MTADTIAAMARVNFIAEQDHKQAQKMYRHRLGVHLLALREEHDMDDYAIKQATGIGIVTIDAILNRKVEDVPGA